MNSKIMRVGLDLAKSVFVVYGVDERGKCRLRRHMRRGDVLTSGRNTPTTEAEYSSAVRLDVIHASRRFVM